jgi:TRAP transporter TAXI family solute receptor
VSRRVVTGAIALVAAAAAQGFLIPGASAQMDPPKKQFLALATSSVGGTWFPLGGAMAGLISKKYPQLNVNVEATGGTVDNLKLMKNRKVELAYSTADQAYAAFRGEGKFEDKIDNIRGLLGGHAITWQMVTVKDRGINSIRDLKGKRVALGAAGSIGNSIGQIVIEAHGLKMNEDWKPEYVGHSQGAGAVRDGQVDAVLIIGSVPTGNLTDLISTYGENAIFLNPEPAVLEKLLAERPYWAKAKIAGGAYKGHEKDILGTFAVSTILIADEKLPDAAAYAITKTLLESNSELVKAHDLAKEWTKENATRGIKGVIPLHPGAEAYLKEAGLL